MYIPGGIIACMYIHCIHTYMAVRYQACIYLVVSCTYVHTWLFGGEVRIYIRTYVSGCLEGGIMHVRSYLAVWRGGIYVCTYVSRVVLCMYVHTWLFGGEVCIYTCTYIPGCLEGRYVSTHVRTYLAVWRGGMYLHMYIHTWLFGGEVTGWKAER